MSQFKLNSIMLLIASSWSMNTIAQEEQLLNTKKDSIENIVIQGSKQELTLQEVDSSVELFTKERLSSESIADLNDLLVRIPNVASTGKASNFSIRGIGRNGAAGAGRGVTSNVYLDGSPLSGTALGRGATSLWDTQQVEVLRGSQSSIQGRNALAGAIVVTSADPTYQQDGKVRLTYAENNTYQLAGAYGNAIIEDQLAFRLAADFQKTDGFIEHDLFDKNTNFEDRLMLRGKLLFEPKAIDDLTMKLIIDHNDIKIGNGGNAVRTNFPVTSPEYESFNIFDFKDSGDNPRNKTETTRFILDTYYDISKNWSIKNILTHEKTEVDRVFGDRELLEEIELFANNFFEESINTAELRLTFDYDNISGVIGAYYFKANAPQTNTNELLLNPEVIAATGGFGFVTPYTSTLQTSLDYETTTQNTAFFAQLRIDLTNDLLLDLGIRYDDERFENSGYMNEERIINPADCQATVPGVVIGLPIPIVDMPCNTLVDAFLGEATGQPAQEAEYNAWLPKLTLTYQINTDHSIFASMQRGYRAGGSYMTLAPNPNGVGSIQIFDTYDPEYLDTIEIGNRSIFADGDIVLNANIFYSNYKEQQVLLPGESLANAQDDIIANVAKSSLYGVELMLEYYLSQQWDIYASLGLLNAEFDDFPFAEQGEFSNLKGNKFAGSPEVSASISANWTSESGWFANISAYYTSSRHSNAQNLTNSDIYDVAIDAGVSSELASTFTEEVDAYANINLRFGYEMDDVIIYAYATNVLDEEVVTSSNIAGVDSISGEVSLETGGTNSSILPPRVFGIGLDYAF